VELMFGVTLTVSLRQSLVMTSERDDDDDERAADAG